MTGSDTAPTQTSPHKLELRSVELVGGGREVYFHPGLNIVQGDITTGKTTFVRLIRAMLGTFPSDLAPEVNLISAIRGDVLLGQTPWQIYRPRTTSRDALIEVAELTSTPGREPSARRLPATGRDSSYSTFLLENLQIPVVSVPQARSQPTGSLTAVSMTDWLGYCIIPGDELDTQVFGHRHPFRDIKRRWVFERAYGYYDPELARLTAELRSVELRLESLDHDAAIQARFLADTPFASSVALEDELASTHARIADLTRTRAGLSLAAQDAPGVEPLRRALLIARERHSDLTSQLGRMEGQLKDLFDLERQLRSQSSRLTRAVVADEWLVDFDFIVCPRCGNDVDAGRVPAHLCYLCQQEPQPLASRDDLLAEQDRLTSQINETRDLIKSRQRSRDQLVRDGADLDGQIKSLSERLDVATSAFISDAAARLEENASEQARLESNVTRLEEYLRLVQRHEMHASERPSLEAKRDEVSAQIERHELSKSGAEANVRALEARMLDYLSELHIPQLSEDLSVRINRNTYMPEVAGRSFDELSSQGLKTLVNVAHSLAHHTVAIDRDLPLPGLLVLDGLSANAGLEGFDQARISDVYDLLMSAADAYKGSLQIVAVDNDLSRDILMKMLTEIVLTLRQEDRLIRIA
jgi:hypothetical protein